MHHTGPSTALELLVDTPWVGSNASAVPSAVADLLDLQAGVIARRQLVSRGWADHDIARMLRRRVWASVFEGIYVNHTGELTWLQGAWAAVLFSWPAALSHASALRAADGPGRRDADEGLVRVMVERDRRLACPPGVELHRRRAFGKHVLWNLGPPRVRYEQAAIDVATSAESEYAAVAVLSQAVQSRRTTARRMLSAMAERQRLPRRQWVAGVLGDIEEGTCSVLEHGYLARVERPHRLPRGRRQVADVGKSGRIYRDVTYRLPLVVELDGRMFHDSTSARDQDFDRDLLAQVEGQLTTRLSWGQVFDRPCWTARQVGVLLQQRGWTGAPTPCCTECGLRG
jgi:hypothetical protein